MGDVHRLQRGCCQVVGHGFRQNEVAIGETLHERAGTEPVGAVIREVRFIGHKQSRDGRRHVIDYR